MSGSASAFQGSLDSKQQAEASGPSASSSKMSASQDLTVSGPQLPQTTPQLPPYSVADTDPPSPNFTARRSLIVRALGGTVLYGFKKCPVLANAGIDLIQWKMFTAELQNLINPHRNSENAVYAVLGITGGLFAPGIFIMGLMVGLSCLYYSDRKQKCRTRFADSQVNGELNAFLTSWNTSYFEPRGLHVHVEAPDTSGVKKSFFSDLNDTDIYYPRMAEKYWTTPPGGITSQLDERELRKYTDRELRYKFRAMHRFRIVISPVTPTPLAISSQASGQVTGSV